MMHAFASAPRAAAHEAHEGSSSRPLTDGPIGAKARLAVVALATALAACAAAQPTAAYPTAVAAREGGESAGNTRNDPPSADPPPSTAATPAAAPAPPQELPRGGRTIFPNYRLVGFCGTPGAPELGELQGNFPKEVKELEARSAPYTTVRGKARPLLPVFELIAVVVQSGAGPDGKYRRRVDNSIVDAYLKAARQSKALLLLNIQPGQSDFLTEVKTFDSYLHEPDVGVALDPEWAMKPNQRPGKYYGQTDGETINEVAEYLSNIVHEGNLPEKALVFHQVNRGVLKDEIQLKPFPGVVTIKSVDGLGPVHSKIETYDYLMVTMRHGIHPGFKLFFDEDTRNGNRIMSAKEVLALRPAPEYVMYE